MSLPMTIRGSAPTAKVCPNCQAENRPLAPRCTSCGFDFFAASRPAASTRGRRLTLVTIGVVGLLVAAFGSYWFWWVAQAPGARPAATVVVRVALASSDLPSITPPFTLSTGPGVSVMENCCNTSRTMFSRLIITGADPTADSAGPTARRSASPAPAFTVTATHPELFAQQPAIDAAGWLTFRTAANRSGTAVLTVAAGAGPPRTFMINVLYVNQPPIANDDAFSVGRDSGATDLPVLANDFAGPPEDQPGGPHAQTIAIASASPGSAGGTVRISAGGAVLEYIPAPGFSGTETFTYVIRDRGSDSSEESALSEPATVRVTVGP
ncbi:MAG: Ig-like domain-containing protein [Candidatus Limnocylindrales bacterium]